MYNIRMFLNERMEWGDDLSIIYIYFKYNLILKQ